MAIFNSQIYGSISGSVNGLTFSHNRFGQYTRRRAVPVAPISDRQGTVRAYMTSAAQAWRNLSEEQREVWTAIAATLSRTNAIGGSYTPTGSGLFQEVNVARLNVGQVLLLNAAVSTVLPVVSDFQIETLDQTGAGTMAFNAVVLDGAAGNFVNIWASPPQTPGRNFVSEGLIAYLGTFAGNTDFAPIGGVDILALYEAKYGLGWTEGGFTNGKIVFALNTQSSNGYKSPKVKIVGIISA